MASLWHFTACWGSDESGGTSDGFRGPPMSSDWALALVSVYHNGAWICRPFCSSLFYSLGSHFDSFRLLPESSWSSTTKLHKRVIIHSRVVRLSRTLMETVKIINLCSDSSRRVCDVRLPRRLLRECKSAERREFYPLLWCLSYGPSIRHN